ncbi:hypothetical protein HK099_001019 [Clydaea vesicula]|uniref:Uncharacterized protein n=1 Tax=Clydaea vesicula TaxID=447962 RepID=A0AAD5TU65_9FUNG|nr:hypothetical protein HK099_001019 [Clydaea vesicula]
MSDLKKGKKSIWKIVPDLESLQQFSNRIGISNKLDIKFSKVGLDFLEATMLVSENCIQPRGLLHGGVSCVLGV